MNKTVELTWKNIKERVSAIDIPGRKIYGVPTGGMICASMLERATVVFDPKEANFILDDLLDSGKTARYYMERYPEATFAVLYNKKKDFGDPNRWVVFPWEKDHPSRDETIETNIVRILQSIGEDVEREGLKDTPTRVKKSFAHIYGGYSVNLDSLFTCFEKETYDEIVLLKDIEFYSTCEHHMLPFYGKAHVAYIPKKNVIGISKLARILDAFARRLQIQERIGVQVTDLLDQNLEPLGSACIIEAKHMCMCMRGVNKQNSIMKTSTLTGVFRTDKAARNELMSMIS